MRNSKKHSVNRRVVSPAAQRKRRRVRVQRWRQRTAWALGLLGLVIAVGLIWRWQVQMPVKTIKITGAHHADVDELRALAETDSLLYELDPALIADRLQRHPWIADVTVARLPLGTLSIGVTERRPVAGIINAQGRFVGYLDAEGYVLPDVANAAYDVPLVRRAPMPRQRHTPIAHVGLQDLLALLPNLDPALNRLIAEIEVQPKDQLMIRTAPTHQGHSIPVRLGRGGFVEKLQRLDAFWHRAVQTFEDRTIDHIDLRFAGQILTRETSISESGG